jgi:hypothetical protein
MTRSFKNTHMVEYGRSCWSIAHHLSSSLKFACYEADVRTNSACNCRNCTKWYEDVLALIACEECLTGTETFRNELQPVCADSDTCGNDPQARAVVTGVTGAWHLPVL